MAKLIFGCGYLGERVARRWLESGEQVFAVTRSPSRAQALAARGLTPVLADVTRPESLTGLPSASTVLFAVGFDRTAGVPMRQVQVAGLQAALAALAVGTDRFVYVSSTGVFAQSHGEWVTEQSACQPQREQGKICLEAEQALSAHPLGNQAIILRMAGLYGPGRIPNAQRIRDHEPIAVADQGWLNLIHVDDAAEVVLAAETRSTPPRMYLVSDGHPVERQEYYAQLARLLNAPPPRFTAADVGAASSQRAMSNKRIDNARLQTELGLAFRYPTYREGLAAIVATEFT
jgi:nucleoside-diphosphate-sugar epimerase